MHIYHFTFSTNTDSIAKARRLGVECSEGGLEKLTQFPC
jgi:acetaldehyde dehydrogenase (acetylating)